MRSPVQIHRLYLRLRSLALSCVLLSLPGVLHAQAQEAQWRVISVTSPTVLPLYAGQSSPFPQQAAKTTETQAVLGPTDEELALQKQREEMYQETRKMVMSEAGREPEVKGFKCYGVLQGPQGWSALCNGTWSRTGAKFKVPARLSAKAEAALDTLTNLDSGAASELRAGAQQSLAGAKLVVVIDKITSQTLVLKYGGMAWQVAIRQGKN